MEGVGGDWLRPSLKDRFRIEERRARFFFASCVTYQMAFLYLALARTDHSGMGSGVLTFVGIFIASGWTFARQEQLTLTVREALLFLLCR